MSFMNRYATDKVAEEQGVWVSLDDDVAVKVARLSNKKAREERRALERPFRNFSSIPDSESEKILIKVLAKAVIKDWKGVTDEKGKDLPFTVENAIKTMELFPDFMGDVVSASAARETYAAEGLDAAKNA